MSNANLVYPGHITINKEKIGNWVSTYVSSARNGIDIEVKNTNKLLSIYGFNSYMVSSLEAILLRDGHYYILSGDDIGVWFWGPIGDPEDGQFEIRKINTLKLGFIYKEDKLCVRAEGISKKGEFHFNGSLDPNYKEELQEWDFRVDFNVDKADIKEFLSFSDERMESFNLELEKIKLL